MTILKTLFRYSVCAAGILLASCNPFSGPDKPEPRQIDWKAEWNRHGARLQALAQDIVLLADKKYQPGNNDFPEGFAYPFDDGFSIESHTAGAHPDRIDANRLTIRFYTDRGLLDHYSAFVFTNDTISIKLLDEKVRQGGGDFKVAPRWYMVND